MSVREDYPEATWVEVESSWISAISFVNALTIEMRDGIDEEHRVGTMLLETLQGQVYEYRGVHYGVVRAICLAKSVGGAFHLLMSSYTTHEMREVRR